MKRITWIHIVSKRYGGAVYGERARESLSQDFEVELKNIKNPNFKWRILKPLEWFVGLLKINSYRDLWIRDDLYSAAMLPLTRTRGKNLVLIHHIDSFGLPIFYRFANFFIEKIFYYNLKKADAIVTVSEYWKNHFLDKNFSNVYKIYPGFNLADFEIRGSEVSEFKKKFGFEKKPIIYIGNCQRDKGVVESYQALKDLDVYLVTSGYQQVKIPALNFNLEYRDYLKLLKAASIAITMSKFKEGWCMTAQEAMLLKTPVIGSGSGGMRELLEGGKQIVCRDFLQLKEKVEYLLKHPEIRQKMGEDGYSFSKNFTMEKFKDDWLNLIKKVLNENRLS